MFSGKAGFIRCVALVVLGLAMPAGAREMSQKDLEAALMRMLSGQSALQGAELEAAIAKAETHPLGSRDNPVRVGLPTGERAYLARLRCSDGKAPVSVRLGNVGPGVYQNIVDHYRVTCEGAEPAQADVYMDMYHAGHREDRPVPGFSMADTADGKI